MFTYDAFVLGMKENVDLLIVIVLLLMANVYVVMFMFDDERYKVRLNRRVTKKFYRLLKQNGYIGNFNEDLKEFIFIDDESLAKEIERITKEVDLQSMGPQFSLNIRDMTILAPETLRCKYNKLLMTPTHAIGFEHV